MSPYTLKPVACRVPPTTIANGSDPKPAKVDVHSRKSLPFLQMKEKEKALLQENHLSTSRREMLHFTAASLSLLPLTLPLNAEASPRNITMRQKIMDKLEKLRQKAGLSKPKDEVAEQKRPKGEDEDRKLKSEDKGKKLSEEKKTKVEEQQKKAEPKNGTDEEKNSQTEPSSKVPLQEHPLIPSLPNILNDKTIKPNLP